MTERPFPSPRRWIVGLASVLVGLALVLTMVIAVAVARYYPELPELDRVTEYQPRLPLQVFTSDGVEIAQFGSERRQFLPIEQIPPMMQAAVLAVEDARFREHSGLDVKGIARAVWVNLSGGRRQGASTITQQVARNFFLSSQRTFERKFKEALLAIKIEQQLSKDRILELYMNQIYLGQRAYGFGAAAQVYFGKPLKELSVAEMAMLAGLPQNPAFANPITNLAKATTRQHVVLMRMLETGAIDQAAHDAAKAQTLQLQTRPQVTVHAEYVAEMARKAVYEQFGEEAYTQGIQVYTSLVAAEQQAAWSALRRGILDHERKQAWRGPENQEDLPDDPAAVEAAAAQILKEQRDDEDLRVALVHQAGPREIVAQLATGEMVKITGDGLKPGQTGLSPKAPPALAIRRGAILRLTQHPKTGWQIAQWPQAQGAIVAMTPATGRIRALVGGFDFTRQKFNHVTQAWRQPGSSFKPFLYSAALEHGIMPATLVNDAPLTIGDWSPQNSDGQFDGPMSLRRALAKSKNLVSIRLVQMMGVGNARQWVSRFGFEADRHPDNLTLALGAGSVTPLQMAAGYSIFANGGFRVDPVVIERIVGSNGKVLFQAPPAPPLSEELRVVPARNVFIVDSLLQEVTRSGTAARAQGTLKRPDLFGKTGTTNDAVDAWFAGFQPGVAAVVWMGYDDPRSLGSRETGGGLSLPVWISYMERALRGVAVQSYVPPEDVVNVGGDWRYSEFAEGGMVRGVGVEVPDPSVAASAASDAAPAASTTAPLAPPPTPTPVPAPANGAASGVLNGLLSSF
ncbi:MAG: hypothetical protein RLZZ494_1224 [Pseudomonadota bacterium]